LTTASFRLKIRPFRRKFTSEPSRPGNEMLESMTTSRPSQPPGNNDKGENCNHPRVRVVAREEDAEFVECLECGDVFESSEFKDMQIEESRLKEN
jgi:hypothetical protein